MSRFIRYTLLCKAAVFNVPRSDLTVWTQLTCPFKWRTAIRLGASPPPR